MNITVVVPFEDARTQTALWAIEESKIDFLLQPDKAARCTAAFAATELRSYLLRSVLECSMEFKEEPSDGFNIVLEIANQSSKDSSFRIENFSEGVVIRGKGRTGLLLGAYELLRLQGWRWYVPGLRGEISPTPSDALILPTGDMHCSPDMHLGRGLDLEGASKDSTELYLWMIRNRLDVASYRPATHAFCEKLGMNLKIAAGHIFADLLDPASVLPSGESVFEAHPEWYGVRAGAEITESSAMDVQFCVSKLDLMDYLAERLIYYIQDAPAASTAIDVWGFDTWGGICECPECKRLGNGTDQMLHMCSELRERIDAAVATGRLGKNTNLLMCAYEGTSTLEAPENPVPCNLIQAGDYLIYYPILRCYAHGILDSECCRNQIYSKSLNLWNEKANGLKMHFGEYYNVSKFEDLPLLFTSSMPEDIRSYYKCGIRGSTYMHVPMVAWGVRTLTQPLYSQLCWDIDADVDQFLEEYFSNWYGHFAPRMREVYDLVEEAWKFSASWRAWDKCSVLSRLQVWNPGDAFADMDLDKHLVCAENAAEAGAKSAMLLSKAMEILEKVMAEERQTDDGSTGPLTLAVNPRQASSSSAAQQYSWRLGEDRRGLVYGLDVMKLMTLVTSYYDYLLKSECAAAEDCWQSIEQIAAKLDSYYMPMTFDNPGPGFECRDALTRTQLREVLSRCRKHRQSEFHSTA